MLELHIARQPLWSKPYADGLTVFGVSFNLVMELSGSCPQFISNPCKAAPEEAIKSLIFKLQDALDFFAWLLESKSERSDKEEAVLSEETLVFHTHLFVYLILTHLIAIMGVGKGEGLLGVVNFQGQLYNDVKALYSLPLMASIVFLPTQM
ncbi:hypothetical protein I79_013942 [Cricetulus griseus]|uniref:Uncharacterized protein n=1 Tax=Cricetulus griseus TaxID=10029 RepID=G3HSU4_CRIGR|nr:hypothetical protein I79_013942 [Cricetulus griseus]